MLKYTGEITNAIDIWSLGCIIYELMFKIPLFPAKDKNDLVYLLTTLLGLPTIISRYFISPKHDYYFVFCKVNGRYIRRPTIKYYKPCDEFGLTTKLYKEIDIDKFYADLWPKMFRSKYMFHHVFRRGDLLFMDQLHTIHRRSPIKYMDRMLWRAAFDYSNIRF